MAFYQSETRIDEMEIEWVGFDPETGTATINLRRMVDAIGGGETVWIDQKIQMPLALLKAMAFEAEALADAMADDGLTEFDIRKPIQKTI
jgi:hypothetical protein